MNFLNRFFNKHGLLKKDTYNTFRGFRYVCKSSVAKQQIKKFISTIQSEHIGDSFSIPFAKYTLQPISITQFLYSRLINQTFFASINQFFGSHQNKKICVPLPAKWRKNLEDNNFKINHFQSAFFLYLLALGNYFLGIIDGLKLCLRKSSKTHINNQHSSFFVDLSDINFPNNPDSRDILNWYTKYWDQCDEIKTITHNNTNKEFHNDINGFKVRYSSRLFAVEFSSVYERLKFIKLFTILSIKVFFYLIFGKIEPAFMMREMTLFIRARTIKQEKFHKAYFFHSSSILYKPIWLHYAESSGSSAIVYFYAVNFEKLFNEDLDSPICLYTWKNYAVWNQENKNFLNSKLINSPKYILSSPIQFSDNSNELIPYLSSEKKILSIFDVSPVRKSHYINLGIFHEYYSFGTIKSFYRDVIDIAKKLDCQILIKPKRAFTDIHHKGYINLLSNFDKDENIIFLNPDISADRLIEKSDLVVSLPYTSTHFIAKYKKVPSIFYDPFAELSNSRNLNLIQTYENLEKWMRKEISI